MTAHYPTPVNSGIGRQEAAESTRQADDPSEARTFVSPPSLSGWLRNSEALDTPIT